MDKKPFGWYIEAAVAWIFVLAVATCISGVIIKLALSFLTWLF